MVTTGVQDRPMAKMAIWPKGWIPGTQDSHNEGGLMGPPSAVLAECRPEARKRKTNRRASSRPDLLTPLPHPTPGHQVPPTHSARWRKGTAWPLCAAVHRMSPPRRAISQCDGHGSWFPEAQDHKHDLPREYGKEDQQRMLAKCPYSPTTHPNSPLLPPLAKARGHFLSIVLPQCLEYLSLLPPTQKIGIELDYGSERL